MKDDQSTRHRADYILAFSAGAALGAIIVALAHRSDMADVYERGMEHGFNSAKVDCAARWVGR